MKPLVVTLVHGTYARWWYRWHYLERTLKEAFPSITIEHARWSGLNALGSRKRAARRLEVVLTARVQSYPDATHVVIAHSHGGSISLLALHDRILQNSIAGVCTLSTPFFRAEYRPVTNIDRFGIGFLVFFVTLVSSAGIAGKFGLGEDATFGLAFVIGLAMCGGWLEGGEHFLQAAVRDMSLPQLTGLNLLILRTRMDEASTFINTIGALTRLMDFLLSVFRWPSWVLNWIHRPVDNGTLSGFLSRIGLTLLALAALFGLCVLVGVLGADAAAKDGVVVLTMLAMIIVMSPLLAALLLVPIGAAMFVVSFFALGLRLAAATPFLDVTVEDSPSGNWQVHEINVEHRVRGLHHSLTHSHPEAIARLLEWLRTVERADSKHHSDPKLFWHHADEYGCVNTSRKGYSFRSRR